MSQDNNAALILRGIDKPEIQLDVRAENAHKAALATASGIREIVTADDVNKASEALARIKGLKKTMESAHSEVKAPVLDITRKIDGIKKEFCLPLEIEERRLSQLLGAHQERERRIAEEARRKAEQEALRIRAEAEEAERQRIAEEQKGRTGTLIPDLGAIRDKAIQDEVALKQEVANAAALAPAGTQLRQNWKFEVEDIGALYAAFPELVKMEPNKTAINAIIKTGRKLPGLRIWNESVAIVKAAPTSAATIAEQYDY